MRRWLLDVTRRPVVIEALPGFEAAGPFRMSLPHASDASPGRVSDHGLRPDPDPGSERAVRGQPRRRAGAAGGGRDGARQREWLLLQLVLVSIGVGSLVARSDAVFTTLKLLGAAYLVFLGIRNIRDRKQLATLFAPAVAAEPKPLRRIYREGFFVGATNPKGIIIFTAVLPQFVDRSSGHVTLQIATLGAICIAIAMLSDFTWAMVSGTARNWLGRSSRRLERMTAGGGAALIALGFGLALTTRRN